MSLKLVELGLSGAAMFAADGRVLQPSEALRKRSLIVERGRFRPVTHVNIDMLDAAIAKFAESADEDSKNPLPIMEISMHSLSENCDVYLEDFVSRAEVLATTGHTVMISDYPEYYRLAAYLSRYTDRKIGMVMGIGTLHSLFDEKYYEHLDGGILESLGRMFKEQIGLSSRGFCQSCGSAGDNGSHGDDLRLSRVLSTCSLPESLHRSQDRNGHGHWHITQFV